MILIVDDHIDSCRLLIRLLRAEGIEAQCADGGAAALALLESAKPAMIVLDQMMPQMLGTDVLRAIRGIPALGDIPAIFFSATQDGEDEARRLGALDWLVKGKVTWDELRERVVEVYRARVGPGGT